MVHANPISKAIIEKDKETNPSMELGCSMRDYMNEKIVEQNFASYLKIEIDMVVGVSLWKTSW